MPDRTTDPADEYASPSDAMPRDAAASAQAGAAEARGDTTESQLQAWLSLGGEALGVFEQLVAVLRLELGLAFADGKRLVIVLLAMLPLAVFAWLGLCALLAWLAYAATGIVALGLLAFLLLQCGTLFLLWRAARRFQRSLGLPVSRRQLRDLIRAAAPAHDRGQQP